MIKSWLSQKFRIASCLGCFFSGVAFCLAPWWLAVLVLVLGFVLDFFSFKFLTDSMLGSGIGWWLAIVMMAAIRERLQYSHIPAALKGPGIAFIITGLMGIAFMIFSGIQL